MICTNKRKWARQRTVVLALAVCLCLAAMGLAGCDGQNGQPGENEGSVSITMQEVLDANSDDALLARCDSFITQFSGDGFYSQIYKKEDSRIFTTSGEYYEGYRDGRHFFWENGEYVCALPCYDFDPPILEQPSVLNPEITLQEIILSAEQEEGDILLTTLLSGDGAQRVIEAAGVSYAEGDEVITAYRLDAETLIITECQQTIRHEDETTENFMTQYVMLDAEITDEIMDGINERLNDPEGRHVTVVLDPGTSEERAFTAIVRKGEAIQIFLPEDYPGSFSDEACTQPYGDEEGEKEEMRDGTTLYSKRAE